MNRKTPYFDKWVAHLNTALSERGRKSDLARWLAHDDPAKVHRWHVQITKVLKYHVIADGEFVLAVEDWLRRQVKGKKGGKPDRKRRTETRNA